MDITVDTSAILAVLLEEPERDALVALTAGTELIAPQSLHWEIGNALSAMLKRGRISSKDAQSVLRSYRQIPLQLCEVDLVASIEIARELKIYAYDAYMLECARSHRTPLLSLDADLVACAKRKKIKILEVS